MYEQSPTTIEFNTMHYGQQKHCNMQLLLVVINKFTYIHGALPLVNAGSELLVLSYQSGHKQI